MSAGESPGPEIAAIGARLRSRLAAVGMPVASDPPPWSSLTSGYGPVTGAARAAGRGQPQFEVTYRTALARYSHVVAGRLPSAGQGAVAQAVVTTATAARFGLRVGTRLSMGPTLRLVITGIIRPAHPAADFWTDDPAVARPALIAGTSSQPAHWAGALFIGAGGLPLAVSGLNESLMLLSWVVPADLGRLTADQASAVQAGISGLESSGLVISSGGAAVSARASKRARRLPVHDPAGHGDGQLADSGDPDPVRHRGQCRCSRARAAVRQPGRHGRGGGAARRPAGGAAPRRGVHADAGARRGAAPAWLAGPAGQRGHRRGRRGDGRGARHPA